jgi:hypothetical protein
MQRAYRICQKVCLKLNMKKYVHSLVEFYNKCREIKFVLRLIDLQKWMFYIYLFYIYIGRISFKIVEM